MGTDIWFNVEVSGLPDSFKGESLPDFGLINGDKWDASHVWDPEKQELTPTIDEVECSGEGRYDDEQNITAWAQSFTLMVRGTTVTIHTEWHADGYGEERNVYHDGQLVPAESLFNTMISYEVPAPREIAQKVLDNHVIHDHWIRNGEQIRALLIEAIELDRTHTRGT